MKWHQFLDEKQRLVTHAKRSECGRWQVSAARVQGKWIYTLWRRPNERIGNFKSMAAIDRYLKEAA